ncbi:mechanosensitive ion channel domain-containing protein [Acetobacter oeni]|nr:mechanosensitive ion channel domain-containing protein [Acetobacter oeni]
MIWIYLKPSATEDVRLSAAISSGGRRYPVAARILLIGFLLCLAPGIRTALAETNTQTTAVTPLSSKEAQELLNVLNDPKQRENFTHDLSLMARGVQATVPVAATSAPAAKTAAPKQAVANAANTVVLHNDLSSGFSSIKSNAAAYLENFLALFKDLKTVGTWFRSEINNPQTRNLLIGAFTRAFIIVGAALLAEWGISLALRKPLHRITDRAVAHEDMSGGKRQPHNSRSTTNKNADLSDVQIAQAAATSGTSDTGAPAEEIQTLETRADDQRRQIETLRFLARIPYTLMHLCLKLVPLGVFLGIAFACSAIATNTSEAATVTETLALAYAAARGLFIFLETIFAPRSPAIRLLPVEDSTAWMLTRWWNILVAGPSIVVCLSVLGGEFDLSDRGTAAMIRAVVLVEHILIAIFIWRLRPIVARALEPKRKAAKSAFWSFMLALAHVWWIPALFLDGALWVVWAVHLRGGYDWILRTTALTIVVIAASRLLAVLAYGAQDRLFRLSPDLVKRRPDLQKRADVYYPFVRGALTAIITFVSFLALTEAWGLNTFQFFFSNRLGSRLLGAAVTVAVAVTVAAAIWEIINAMLNNQLERYSQSAQETRATRLKTVLPIIRTVLRAAIIIIVTVTSLSQIGINVTPLLTGAGIMGAALAFGSQSLVKDFITGFFMLVEDAIQVGDWVTTGGVAGTVEHLSIRTVRVRAINGDLHIIPFSSVTSIANTGRDFNQIIVKQTVDLTEDVSRVVKIMSDAVDQMRKEDAFKGIIYSGYNDLGVDSTDGNGSVIIGSIRTAAMMKWKVQREFYKRIAHPMADQGIKFYTPTSYTASAPGTALNIAGKLSAPPGAPANEDVPASGKPVAEETHPAHADGKTGGKDAAGTGPGDGHNGE